LGGEAVAEEEEEVEAEEPYELFKKFFEVLEEGEE